MDILGYGNGNDNGNVPSGGGDFSAEIARRLSPKHLADLRGSGLSDATILANGYYTESDPAKIAAILGWDRPAKNLGGCLCVPYLDRDGKPLPVIDRETGEIARDANGDPVPFVRVKPDRPRKDKKKNGKHYKYEARRGARNRLYVPAKTWAILAANPTAQIVIVEGEKKAARGAQDGIACVGVSGVDNWSLPRPPAVSGQPRPPRLPLPDFDALSLDARPVGICYDSDAATNLSVRWAEWNLALALTDMGACVGVVRLPSEPDGGKNGLDDYLVRYGLKSFEGLLLAAAPPAHPTTGACNLSVIVGERGEKEKQSNEHIPPFLKAKLHALRREVMVCERAGWEDMSGVSAKVCGMRGKKCLECGAIATCFPCRYNAVSRWLWWLLPLIAETKRCITIWHKPARDWRALRELLNRRREKYGTPKPDYISVAMPDGTLLVIFFDAPATEKLSPATPAESAGRFVEAMERITACPGTTAKRWRPVRTSFKKPVLEKNWALNRGLLGSDVVEVAVRERHGCPQTKLKGGWRTMSRGEPDAQDRADDELRYGPLSLRHLPVRGFAALDEAWVWGITGQLPADLPPLSEMPQDLDKVCDGIEFLRPGLGRACWERSQIEDPREVLRGLIWWAGRELGITQAEIFAAIREAAPPVEEARQAETPAIVAEPKPTPDITPAPETPFVAAAAEARRLAPVCGPKWAEYVERQIDSGDLATLTSFLSRMREIAGGARLPGREAG